MHEGNRLLDIYLQEFTNTTATLHKIQAALDAEDIVGAKTLLHEAIYQSGKFVVVQQQVQARYPDFVATLDQALEEGMITKGMWQIAHCMKLGMSPLESSQILSVTNRTISTMACHLRKLGILEAIKKKS